jgi:ABC-2 type transport system permease protein
LVAAILGIAILALFSMMMQLVVKYGSEPWNYLASLLNAMTYFKDFSRGVFDTRALAFFLTSSGLFLFLSVKTLESKRWR